MRTNGVIIIGILCAMMIGVMASLLMRDIMRKKAVENNCASYNSASGDFGWDGDGDDETELEEAK